VLVPGRKSGLMETMSSISRRRPQTEVTPYLGNRSGRAGLSESEPASGQEPDTVRASSLCRLVARTSSATGASGSVATRNLLISNLRRLLSNAEEATATAAAAAETEAAATAVAGVDLASSQQISAIGGESKWLSPTTARTLRTGAPGNKPKAL